MPRGFKVAVEETKRARKERRIHSPSFIGFKPDKPTEFHEVLRNLKDIYARRKQIFNVAEGMCQGCTSPHYIPEWEGEWDHIKGGSDRCDCLQNGRWVCVSFHRQRHVHTQWTRKESAA